MHMATETDNVKPVPRHIAIVMDGNGRWAERRHRPRTFGHQAGVRAARRIVESSARRGVEALTLFAFSSENWRRPRTEVDRLMELFAGSLKREVRSLNENGVRLRFIGDLSRFREELRSDMRRAERETESNERMQLCVAMNYGGRWDIVNAVLDCIESGIEPAELDEQAFGDHLCLADLPDPDLFIRTGGERRISNFLLWQLAYTELYFTDTLWPDFDDDALSAAIEDFAGRQRRFGRTGAQVSGASRA